MFALAISVRFSCERLITSCIIIAPSWVKRKQNTHELTTGPSFEYNTGEKLNVYGKVGLMTEYKRDNLCSYVEAGKLLGVSNYTVRDYVERGKLTAVRYGKRPYILKSELAEFVKPSEWKHIRK